LKPGVPAVLGPQPKDAEAVIEARADELGAPLSRWPREWRCVAAGAGMRFAGERWRLDLPLPSLAGAHQIINAGTAIACLEQLEEFPLSSALIATGLRQIEWPARLQRLTRGVLVEMMPPGWELWLDGGHNPGAGVVLADAVAGWCDRPLYLVVGMLNTKDTAGFLHPLAPYAAALAAVTIPGEENPHHAEAIAAAARSLGIQGSTAPSVEDLRLAASRRYSAGREQLTASDMAMPFDTLKLARRLESAGFPPQQAGDMAEAIAEAISELVTKTDLQTAMRDLEQRLTIRLGGMMVVAVGIILAGFKLIH
jgi:dihydrofolate synthase/folylpolyglutamate synthase